MVLVFVVVSSIVVVNVVVAIVLPTSVWPLFSVVVVGGFADVDTSLSTSALSVAVLAAFAYSIGLRYVLYLP